MTLFSRPVIFLTVSRRSNRLTDQLFVLSAKYHGFEVFDGIGGPTRPLRKPTRNSVGITSEHKTCDKRMKRLLVSGYAKFLRSHYFKRARISVSPLMLGSQIRTPILDE